ncbi:helix-turn-helix domain-containing protein [Acidobacteriota bacterium]
MVITFDRKADAGYIKFSKKKIEKTKHVSDYCQVDLDAEGGVIGIELLNISQYMDDFKIWLDLNNAAEYLNKSPITIRRWVKEKKIPYYKPGKEYLFTKEDLDEFINSHKQT